MPISPLSTIDPGQWRCVLGNAAKNNMHIILWLAVVMLSMESLIFGNGTALIAGLIISAVGMFLEIKENKHVIQTDTKR